jgi:TP901 family phage tail tape measure protein
MAIVVPIETKYNPRGVKTAIRDFDDFKRAVDKAGGGIGGFAKISGEMMKSVGGSIKNTGESMTVGLTLPIVGIGAAALVTQAQFEQSMNALQVNSQASGKQMAALGELAKQLGADTVFSANEAAAAMLELSKGGLSPAQIEGGALASTLNLAATEGMALTDAATIMAQSMNTFGISADETAKVVDILAAGAVASTAGVQDLAAGMKYVGTTAKTMNIPLDDTVTALAAMNNAGIDSSTAGTSLNRMLLGLIPTTKKAQVATEKLGLQFTDNTGTVLPFEEIVRQLVDTFGDMDQAARTADLKAIFGVEGMRAANVLIEQGVNGYIDLEKAVNKAGIAADMANARMSGTAGAMEQLKGSLETAALTIGEALAPIILKVTDFLKGFVDRFTALSPEVKQIVVVVGIFAAALGPVLIIVGMLITALGTVVAALGAISAPVLAVIAVIGLLVAGFVMLWTKSEAFREAVTNAFTQVRAVVQQVVDQVRAKLDENRDAINAVRNAFSRVWEFLSTVLIPLLVQFYSIYLQTLIRILGAVLGAVVDLIGGFVRLVAGIVNFVSRSIELISGWLSTLQEAFTNAFNTVRDFISGVFSSIYDNITSTIRNAVNFVVDGVNRIINAWNGLSFTVPGVDLGPLGSFGPYEIGTPDLPNIPRLAEGGIVLPQTGGVLARIAEAGQPEAVIPLPRGSRDLSSIGSTVTIQQGAVQVIVNGGDPAEVQAAVDRAFADLVRELRAS